jgi:parvulin-like peptidyl-prolyl isomerase
MRTTICIFGSVAVLVGLAGWATAQPAPQPAAVVDGSAITMAEVEAILKQAGPTATPLTEAQRRQMRRDALDVLINDMLFQQMMRRIGARINVAEVEKRVAEVAESMKKQGKTLQDYLKESGQNEAQLRSEIVTMLQWAAYVKDHFSDADIKKYYDDNRDFFDRVAVRASHIVMRTSLTAPDVEQRATRAKLEALRQDILAGKIDFADAARKYSQDTTAANGGDIGYFPRKLVVDENYARTAYALKVGEISPVVQTEFGMYLIKVTDRKPGQPSDFTQIKDAVKELCVEEARMALIAQYRKAAKVEINLP